MEKTNGNNEQILEQETVENQESKEYTCQEKPKQARNAFVNAFLLALITGLFETLCLGHFFIRIFN